MSEPTTAVAPPAEPTAPAQPAFSAITSQDEFDKRISERIARERAKYADYDDLAKKASELDRISESQKSEAQKAIERAEKAEQAAAEHQTALLRYQVAAEKGVPTNLIDLLTGTNKAEMEAVADRLLEHVGPPVSPFEHGPRTPSSALSGNAHMNAQIRRAAGRE